MGKVDDRNTHLAWLGLVWNLKFTNLLFPLSMLREAELSCRQDTRLGVKGSSS